jgi:hypothetical protein
MGMAGFVIGGGIFAMPGRGVWQYALIRQYALGVGNFPYPYFG